MNQGRPDWAARIRVARAAARMEQRELADRLSVSVGAVRRMESGERRITSEDLEAVGEACDVPEWFMGEGWGGRGDLHPGPRVAAPSSAAVRDALMAELLQELQETVADVREELEGPHGDSYEDELRRARAHFRMKGLMAQMRQLINPSDDPATAGEQVE